jgi:CheY-like chemotaxis protein
MPARGSKHDECEVLRARVVLVVDDVEDVADSLCVLLELYGVIVHVARSAEEARDMALKLVPDVVLLDLQLGDGSGYDVARFLRERQAFNNTRIVAHSALSPEMHAPLTKQKGFDDFVLKAGPTNELLRALGISAPQYDRA